jgi:hypothetical protein
MDLLNDLQGQVSSCETEKADLVEMLFVNFDIDDLPLASFRAEMETEFAIQRPMMMFPSNCDVVYPAVCQGSEDMVSGLRTAI